MKKVIALALATLLLTGCGSTTVAEVTTVPATEAQPAATQPVVSETSGQVYTSRFDTVTEIVLSDSGITVNGGEETETVFTSHDIVYYENKDAYESGNPYGEGTDADKHTAEEAAAHTVVNITAPGAYRVSGSLSAGQIRIDLGEDAYDEEDAVVELILSDADITCSVAPAILFLNTYECDGNWSTDDAQPDVDTSTAGANLILEGSNTVHGAYVAKIFKDKDGEKKLWKQDGAIYSYMSMNVYGPGALALTADNEGLDTELHLTIHGGDISIFSDNDGINTNEDGVSVTTINGGNVSILAGLGAEGDGIDSNGYLVINGGTIISSANPAADAGMDSDLGSFIHGGTVIALGSTMDWAESDSEQVTMNLQFAGQQNPGTIQITTADSTEVFSYDLAALERSFSGMILSAPALTQGETYQVWLNGVQQQYTGTDVGRGGFGGGRGMGGQRPEGMENMTPLEGFDGEMPTMPEGMEPGEMPEGGFGRGQRPDGMEDMTPPEGFDGQMPSDMARPELPEGETFPEGEMPQMPEGGFSERGPGNMSAEDGEPSSEFYMADKVNAFSGVSAVSA